MRKPRALAPGDRLAVVSPASWCPRDVFDRGIEEVRRLGFVPVYDDSVFARARFTSGSPELRAGAIARAWRDPSIAGVIGVRGGYGSAQVLLLLDLAEARLVTKPFIGYSDLTAVLTFLTLGCGLIAFHGPTLDGRLARGADGYDRDSLLHAVSRREPMGELTGPGVEIVRAGEASGLIHGGNLRLLAASLGTPFAFAPPPGYILFFEDIGERPYRLDRMLTQLRQAGVLSKAAAVVVGELTNCDEPSGEVTARDVITDQFADFPGPVLMGFPSGHTAGPSLTLPLGVRTRVVARARPAVVIEEAAVE